MSTSSRSVSTVKCDAPGCREHARSDAMRVGSTPSVRVRLRLRGWMVNVPNPDPDDHTRLDFCPAHKYEEA